MTGRGVFDWYEMTFDTVDDDRVPKHLAIALGGLLSRVKGRNGYAEGWAVERDGSVVATVYRASARAGEVHISVTGGACREVVPVLRGLYPAHRVSRADVALDFVADFEALEPLVTAFGEDRGLASVLITNSEGGATRYLGSPRSEARGRLYKKTEEMRQKHPEAASEVPDGIVRWELVVRPGKRAVKERVATMEPDELFGLAGWAQDLAQQLFQVDVERISTHFRRPPEWTRALHYLGLQYGPMIQRRAAEMGADEVLAEVLDALGLLETV